MIDRSVLTIYLDSGSPREGDKYWENYGNNLVHNYRTVTTLRLLQEVKFMLSSVNIFKI